MTFNIIFIYTRKDDMTIECRSTLSAEIFAYGLSETEAYENYMQKWNKYSDECKGLAHKTADASQNVYVIDYTCKLVE